MNHFSTYDILSLTTKLEKSLGDISEGEIQMFSYLACILSILDGKSANTWGYSFIKNEFGSPYSEAINSSLESLFTNNSLILDSEYYKINESSSLKLKILSKLGLYKSRETYLEIATNCIKFIPYSSVRKALFCEPSLKIAIKNKNRRLLLDEESASIHLLYSQFEKLTKALAGNYNNKVIPALVWMSYNTKTQLG